MKYIKRTVAAVLASIVSMGAFAQVDRFDENILKPGVKVSVVIKAFGPVKTTSVYDDDTCNLGNAMVWSTIDGKQILDAKFCNEKLVSYRIVKK